MSSREDDPARRAGRPVPDEAESSSPSQRFTMSQANAKYCANCNQMSPRLDDGTCMKCRSLVAARTLPLGIRSSELRRTKGGRLIEDSDEDPFAGKADPLIGVVVADRYRIVEPLGRGGMGIVYKVEHTRIGKLLAMKLLAGELSRNQDVVRRFKHEALTASRLSSPNTVQVFDYGATDGLTYLVMELVTGEDLGRLLKTEGKLPVERLGPIVIQVANSLAEAHNNGIVHRDVKPENVMILRAHNGAELAKVLDFGLAKLREGSELSELTSAGAVVGTPYYMSPEQVRGEQVDNRSDIYSLGAMMYRAATGEFPFQGTSPMAVFAKHLTENPTPPHMVCEITIGMSEVIMRALEKDPADRFQRVEDLQAAVVRELELLGTSGIEVLLDSGAIRRLSPDKRVAEAKDGIATRDELDTYERSLRRKRYFMLAAVFSIPLLGLGAGAHYLLKARPVTFAGEESEPNNQPSTANEVPFGRGVNGTHGKRETATQADIDFFSVEVPDNTEAVTVGLTALPNIPLCLMIYARGTTSPMGQYCSGRPGADLTIPALRITPGPYLFAVIQDMDPHGNGPAPFVQENISDPYQLDVAASSIDSDFEVEPNDESTSALAVPLGKTVRGVFAWTGDVDIVCAKVEGTNKYRFKIEDGSREGGALLSAALTTAGSEGAAIRVRPSALAKPAKNEFVSPFIGFEFRGTSTSCVVLRATIDAADPTKSNDIVPRGSKTEWKVSVEPAP